MADIILIVDPFSTGKMYAKQFHQLGYHCYAVLSNPNVPDFFQNSADFDNFEQKNFLSKAQAITQFAPDSIKAVIVGSETGLFIGEELAEYFQVKHNSPQTSHLRRDKFAMQQQLQRSGLDYIDSQIITQSTSLPLFKSHAAYVLKPLNAAGTEGVIFCPNQSQLIKHIEQIEWGKTNITGEKNNAFLVQEFISGEEFVVDMVADQQQIYTVSLCRYRKGTHNHSQFVYENMEMLDPNSAEYRPLIRYAHQCATALGFEFGPIHMEIMHSPNRTVMIEAGGRLHGGVAPHIFQQCYQPDLLTQAVNTYHKNAKPVQTIQTQYAKVVFMINDKLNAQLDSTLFTAKVQQFSSFYDIIITQKNPLPLTIDLLTCPCFISLVSSDKQALETDEEQLRDLFRACLH